MRTPSFVTSFIVVAASVTTLGASAAADVTPCPGVQFVTHLETIGLVSNALSLLNGTEDPKLKRLLEHRLVAAAEDAKRLLDQEIVVQGVALRNWASPLRRARLYAADHHLPETVVSNLAALEEWALKQPWGLSTAPH